MDEIQPLPGSFIQFACGTNQTADGSGEGDRNCLFTKHLLDNIARKNVDVADVFLDISNNVYRDSNHAQKPTSMNGLDRYGRVFLNEVIEPDISKLYKMLDEETIRSCLTAPITRVLTKRV